MMNLTDKQVWTAINALRVAADRYTDDAAAMRAAGGAYTRVAEQFDAQVNEARELADKLETMELVS